MAEKLSELDTWHAYCARHRAAKRAEDPEEAVAMGHAPKPRRDDDAPEEGAQ